MILPPTREHIRTCANALASGLCVAFPTETVYGLGANALDSTAVKRIFAIKGRPSTNPLIVHLATPDEVAKCAVVESNRVAVRLERASSLWPGPLSLVLPRAPSVPLEVTAGGSTVAVRIPDHPVALELIKTAGVPVAAPSANPSNYVSPTTAQHVLDSLAGKVPLILDGGDCVVGLESTVVSLVSESVTILRPGGITCEELEDVLGERVELRKTSTSVVAPSPGLHLLHYSPRTRCVLRGTLPPSSYPAATALLSFGENSTDLEFDYQSVETLSTSGNLQEVAARLFGALRSLDKRGFELIVIDTCADEGLGLAIMDRLRRAVAQA